jgi:hypothetical protein
MLNKRGQVTIFIIIGILIVAGVGLFFTFQDSIVGTSVPTTLEPVYNQFLECVKENTLTGINVMESQAGYIYLPEFEKGSEYMPFSSQLDFLGSAVPYWYYVSENGFEKEQVVSISDMETDLERFVEEQINDCDFDSYYEDEFLIDYGVVEAKANIKSEKVEIKLDMGMTIEKADESIFIKDHRVSVNSNLGKLYDSAIEVYEKEQDEFFLEEYAIDTLNLYAPVEGVEFTCSPQTWIVEEVFDELQQAIEDNTLSLKSKGGNYILNNKENEYFVVDVNSDVKFFNSVNWPYSFEVSPSDEAIMVTEPIGNQQGLGVLGFCYAPYHFVYNVKYPVLVQVQEGEEIFQFPLAVVIQGNKPREGLDVEIFEVEDLETCKYQNTLTSVSAYDSNGNSILAEISYECSGAVCRIGQAPLNENFPQCVNGYVLAEAEGYKSGRHLYSTLEEGSVSIVLDKLHDSVVELKLNNQNYNGKAVINFVSEEGSKTILYPDQKNVMLSAGNYEVQVYVYKDSSLILGASTKEQCIETIAPGIRGLLGIKTKECFEIAVPEQIISEVLAGGGKLDYTISENQLKSSEVIEINAQGLATPTNMEELQQNYNLFETKSLEIILR